MARPFTPDQTRYILNNPNFSVQGYYAYFPSDAERSPDSILRHRRRYREERDQVLAKQPILAQKADDPQVYWDKAEQDFHWTDVLEPLEQLSAISKAASGSQDIANIVIDSDEPVPIVFLSDWHIGSWGTSHRKIAEMTRLLLDNNLRVALLGDMAQMSIKMRGVLEMSDNALTPAMQMRFLESWAEDMAHLILWSTWDNHSVEREEAAVGFSQYAEIFRRKCVYHSGIGHIGLTVGEETYRIASSHRFSGNTALNPLSGQKRYMRFEGIDRELAVAGDSHRPALEAYADGPLARLAINCGSLQQGSGHAKRFFSLYTHDWMPTVLFYPDKHLMIPFQSLEHYLAMKEAA